MRALWNAIMGSGAAPASVTCTPRNGMDFMEERLVVTDGIDATPRGAKRWLSLSA